MSHFTVLVIGENPEQQLAPYQENNMGDCPPEFMEFFDIEDDCRREYGEDSVESVVVTADWVEKQARMLTTTDYAKRVDATLQQLQAGIKEGKTEFFLAPWDDLFRIPGTFGNGGGSHEAPSDLERREVPFKNLFPTFEAFMAEWHGHEERNAETGRYGYYENPNAKWDWYQIGGRWSGFFKVKPIRLLADASSLKTFGFSSAEIETLVKKYQTDRATFNRLVAKYSGKSKEIAQAIENLLAPVFPKDAKKGERSWCNENAEISQDRVDQLRKRDLDLEGMYTEAEKSATEAYDLLEAATQGIASPKPFEDFLKDFSDRETGLKAWWEHPWVSAISQSKNLTLPLFGPSADEYFCVHNGGRESFVRKARLNSISTYALLVGGKWYARGEMGWFGCSRDAKSEQEWLEEFHDLLALVSDDTLLTVVDCHI